MSVSGSSRAVSDEQPEKALFPIAVILSDISTLFKSSQFLKVDAPIKVILFGSLTSVRLLQPVKVEASEVTFVSFEKSALFIFVFSNTLPFISSRFIHSERSASSRKDAPLNAESMLFKSFPSLIDFSQIQPLNAFVPIVTSCVENGTALRPVQFENAPYETSVIFSYPLNSLSAPQPLNISAGITLIFPLKSTLRSDVHCINTPFPKLSADGGITAAFIPLCLKAHSPKLLTDDISNDVRRISS